MGHRELANLTGEDLTRLLLGLESRVQVLTCAIQGAYEALLDDEVALALDILRDYAFTYPPLSRSPRGVSRVEGGDMP